MKGKRARGCRLFTQAIINNDPEAYKVRHTNVRHKEAQVDTGLLNPTTGLPETKVVTFTTSTHVIPGKRLYRTLKDGMKQ